MKKMPEQRPFITVTIGEPLFEAEKRLILATLTANAGNQSKTASILQINRNTLRSRMREYGVLS
jgi:DNA-binding NtrC family response regulator